MNFAFLTPGTGSYYCGACMRDNALAKSLLAAGHQVSLLPMYLPLQLDEEMLSQAHNPIFFGGINVYFQQNLSLFRHAPRWLDDFLNNSKLLRFVAKRSHMTSARVHGAMALAMLRIEDSHFGKELDKLIDWLATEKPDILCLGTALQAGMIRQLKQRLGVKIICFFQGEDSFLDGLPEPFKTECWAELRDRLKDADLLVAPSQFYAEHIRQRLNAPDLRIEIMPNGIDLEGYLPPNPSTPPVIGYLARMIREKGLPELVEAFIHLRIALKHPDARLHIAGAATVGDSALIGELKQQLATAGLGDQVTWSPNISREEKARMLSSLTLFSVPATYPEAFGLYLIEAMAGGVPVVQPNASSFPEIVSTSQAGLLVPPGDTIALANAWHELLKHPEALHTLREKGRHAAEQSYSVKAMRDRLLDLAMKLDEPEKLEPSPMALTDRKKISFGREPFNGYSHLIGAAAALVGGIILIEQALVNPLLVIACTIYAISLFLAFFSSALFHLVSGPPELCRRLRDFDHYCIGGLIMGTFAPLAVRMLPWAWALACLVYLITVATVSAVVTSRRRSEISRSKLSSWYIGMATLSLFSVPFCWADFWQPILWTAFGSLFYITGAVCYLAKIPRRSMWLNFHEVWHIFVMIGAFIHYQVILWLV